MIKLGEKIKMLRKQKNISQEVLANYLGVTFQAVSKWETEIAMPDVALIPAIAAFFGVSTDDLFDFDLYSVEKNVETIVDEYSMYWECDRARSEAILREGLRKYPGNDTLLNCLIGTIPVPERAPEVIDLCQTLIAGTRHDDVKYDAYRILAEAYRATGEYALAKEAVEMIPEIYFTKLSVAAQLFEGEDMFAPAVKQKLISFEDLIDMYGLLADHYMKRGESEKALIQLETERDIILAVKNDFETQHTRKLYDPERLAEVEEKIRRCKQS